ncbi:hypothetical protein CYY_000566 [Polysphondylium violaceum]|uniref:Pleckstrin domain-containing protein n=1 Tax=Polysphondylium violaceum TaxID=133409 RepID=A0A8J4Q2I1_9MYCE|nr:hypothetical protein CYY_000566 [Polysphondylium violaceum]
MSKTTIFGVDLECVVKQNPISSNIPNIVTEIVNWLEKSDAVHEEGLFRIPGNGVVIQELKKSFNEGTADLSKFTSADIHTVAGLLKLYLRELPEPLFIWRYYSTFIKVVRNPDLLQRMLHLRMLVYGLPKVNRDLVIYIMTFLNKVAVNHLTNKMTASNLATVFAPNILRPEKESLNQIMEDATWVSSTIKHLIEEIGFISKQSIHLSTSEEDVPSALVPKSAATSSLPSSASNGSLSHSMSNSSISSMGSSGSKEDCLFAKALYPYVTSGQWHLPFKKDDQIILLDIKSEEGWLKGELNGKIGYFPASYVEIVAVPRPVGSPMTLVPIPDFDSQDSFSTPPLSASSSSISSLSSENNNSTSNTTTPPATTNEQSHSPQSIGSVSKSGSSTSLRAVPTRSSSNLLISNPPTGANSGSTSTTKSSSPAGSFVSLSSSPDLTKIMAKTVSPLSSSSHNVPAPLNFPPPLPLSTPPSLSSSSSSIAFGAPPSIPTSNGSGSSTNLAHTNSRSGSFMSNSSSSNTSPDLGKVMSTTPKLSFSTGLPPVLSAPPPLLPSKLLGSQLSSLSLSGNISPPNASATTKSGSFLDTFPTSAPPPPPLSIPPLSAPPPPLNTNFPTIVPPPINATPQKPQSAPLPIDMANLPPPPFSPCSPEPTNENKQFPTDGSLPPPPPIFDLPPPPPMDSGLSLPPPPPFVDINVAGSIPPPPPFSPDNFVDNNSNGPITTAPPPPPPPPRKLDRTMSYSYKRQVNQEKLIEEEKKRKERAEETLSTERTYVKQLSVVYENFIEPFKKNPKQFGISQEDVMNIFSCLEVILTGHKSNLLKAIEERYLIWDQKPQLGDIFSNNTSFIKLYKHYVNNFDKSMATLKQCKEKSPEFKQYMTSLDYTEKMSGLSLESFLILPIQRLPRYVLLLQDLLKYTNTGHEDFNQLCEALGTIKDLTESINFKKKEEDNNMKLQQISDQIKNLPPHTMASRRSFIEEGPILMKKEKYYIFLFSDAIILTKPGKEKKKFKSVINLQTSSLNTTDEVGVLKLMSREGTYKFQVENQKDREHWIKNFKDAIELARLDMIQSAFGESVTVNEGSKGFNRIQDEKNYQHKKDLAKDLVTSEEEYVGQLTYIQNTFLSPIRKSIDTPNPMMTYTENLEISSNFETLLNCHITFLAILKERFANWDDKPMLSDVFLEKGQFLKLYNYYVQNHIKSLQVLDSCIEKYPLFAIHLKRMESDEKAELKALLAEPLRRVSRYYLILRGILQYTRPKQDDHENLSKVVSNLKEQTDKYDITNLFTSGENAGSKSPATKYKTIKLTKQNSKTPSNFYV